MNVPRIEIAEVVSFRLKLPLAEVERLPVILAKELQLTLEREKGEIVISVADGDCSLRFRPVGHDAVLTEIAVCNDEGGTFFQRVLGPLMVRFEGDCELRLVWNTSDRNTHGDFGAVTIRRGQTNYPGLSRPAQALRNALAHGGSQAGALLGGAAQHASSEPPPEPKSGKNQGEKNEAADQGPSPEALAEEAEVDRLLAKAREQFAEYQRLKTARR